jgi:hypothetical protein
MRLRSLSYPKSYPRPQTKRCVARYYGCARQGGQTFNAGSVDLNYLNGFFIEQCRDKLDAIKRVIDANAQGKGWLIFATHDVSDPPSHFGCSPSFFWQVVSYAARNSSVLSAGQTSDLLNLIESGSPSTAS